MFSAGHILLLMICLFLGGGGILYCVNAKPPIERVLFVCMILCFISEVVKILGNIEIVPVMEMVVENGALVYRPTGVFTPYLEAEHLPFELCSYQLFFIPIALYMKRTKWRRRLFDFLYTTCVIGGVMGLLFYFPTTEVSSFLGFFTSVNLWRSFLYHTMLVVLGIYIGVSKECSIRFQDVRWTIFFVLLLDSASFYMNSMMATPYYQGDELMGVAKAINYFNSYNNPLGIIMSNKGQWLIYLGIRILLALSLMILVNLPLRGRVKEKG